MPINLDEELDPIDPDDQKYQAMLDNLQGNILKGHGRDHSINIFIEFEVSNGQVSEQTRESLKDVAAIFVTSALRQHVETRHFKQFKIPGGLFGNFFLTAKGYRALGFSDAQVEAAFPEPVGGPPLQSNFKEGMQAHGDELNDPDPSAWEEGFRDGRIDAMILLADDDEDYLKRQARTLLTELEEFSTVLAVEIGTALRTDEGEGIEHFGYVDGRSQPVFFTTDLPGEGNIDVWDPSEPLNIVLVPDATVGTEDAFGSYFVFRKLEQDVLRFTVREQTLADQLGLVGTDRARAGAMAVGRFRDGTPLVLSQTNGFLPAKENNFTYDADAGAQRCPFQAHIRKTNPRGETNAPNERSRRLTRRGIPYGTRKRDPDVFQALEDLPTRDVGLLFACFQSSIRNQFAFIQKVWVNNENFKEAGSGEDPIIGQRPRPGGLVPPAVPQKWNTEWGQPDTREAVFGNFVTLKGGEFFFAPSIPFLGILAPSSE